MAIRRCPYCKAIIDEQDKYCNNCGTQLLFPEDEFVEEEIPGDKIIDEDESEEMEEKDTTEEQELEAELEEEEKLIDDEEDEEEAEAEDEKDEEGEAEEEGEEEDEDKAEKDESERLAEEKEVEEEGGRPREDRLEAVAGEGRDADEMEELALGDVKDARAELAEKESGPEVEEGEAGTDDQERYEEVEEAEEELEGPDVSGTGEPAWKLAPVEPDKKYEVSIEEDELVIKTKDVPRRSESLAEAIKEKVRPPDTGSLPPWASRIRETPAIVEPEEEAQAPKALSREWTTDSGIGIPERITQAALPDTDTGSPGGPTPGQEKDHVDEESEVETAEEEEALPAGTLSLKLRAKLVDLVFVTALWVISLWFTAQVVGVSFFRLLFGSPLPVLAFYVILLGLYFFLFLYFLGETLGDHYFSE